MMPFSSIPSKASPPPLRLCHLRIYILARNSEASPYLQQADEQIDVADASF